MQLDKDNAPDSEFCCHLLSSLIGALYKRAYCFPIARFVNTLRVERHLCSLNPTYIDVYQLSMFVLENPYAACNDILGSLVVGYLCLVAIATRFIIYGCFPHDTM